MTSNSPVQFRLRDRVRLRKVHPCGGWTWIVTRVGADIGLMCETCERRIMLERSSLEARVKTFLEQGPEPESTQKETMVDPAGKTLTCGMLGIRRGEVFEALRATEASLALFYKTRVDRASSRIPKSMQLRVIDGTDPSDVSAKLEPVEYATYERVFVPGGIRSQESYEGYAFEATCASLARNFSRVDPD